MTSFLQQTDYPETITSSALNKVNNLSQGDALMLVGQQKADQQPSPIHIHLPSPEQPYQLHHLQQPPHVKKQSTHK